MPEKESNENSAPPPPQHRVALDDDHTIAESSLSSLSSICMLCHFTVDLIPKLRDPEGSRQSAEGNPPGSGGRDLHPLSAVAVDPSVALNNDAEDVDEFDGFSETQTRYDGGEVEIDEEDEKVMAAFMSTKSGRSSHWLTSSSRGSKRRNRRSLLNNLSLNWIVESLICIRGKLLSRYTTGKTLKAFKHIPAIEFWEDVLCLTEPENWSPNAMYQATKIFSSNLSVKKAQ
ncbi:unnamed protein product [Musa acuminata subsp. burmannicoides]